MNSSDNKKARGMSQLRMVYSKEFDDTKAHEVPSHGGGGNGGNGMDDLKKRVERTEDNIAQMQIDLAKLTTRSEEFATKSDLLSFVTELKSEISGVRSELKDETSSVKSELKGEISSFSSELKGELSALKSELKDSAASFHKEIASQTRWMIGTMLVIAGLALTAAKFIFA